jgi:hypothetical protein
MDRLPPELIHRVLDFVLVGANTSQLRYRALKPLLTVSSQWKEAVEPLLWEDIAITSQSQAIALLGSSSLGDYRTRKLRLAFTVEAPEQEGFYSFGEGDDSFAQRWKDKLAVQIERERDLVGFVLANLCGLESLTWQMHWVLELALVQSPSLYSSPPLSCSCEWRTDTRPAALTYLRMEIVNVRNRHHNVPASVQALPFQLTQFELFAPFLTSEPFSHLVTSLALGSANTLEAVEVYVHLPACDWTYRSLLPAAKTLTTLSGILHFTDTLWTLVVASTNLKTFSTHKFIAAAELAKLPESLEKIEIEVPAHQPGRYIVSHIYSQLEAIELAHTTTLISLKEVDLVRTPDNGGIIELGSGRETVVERLERKGVRVRFGGKKLEELKGSPMSSPVLA